MDNEIFSKAVVAGKKKYYLDVKTAKTGNKYLSIREVTEGDDAAKKESRRILVFDSDIKKFAEAFKEAEAKIPPKERMKPEAEAAASF